jgi:hypothetical protein
VIEKHNSDLVVLRDQMSSSQATSSAEVTNQLQELRMLVQGISFKEVLDKLKELGISVTDIRGLIVEESKSSGSSYAALHQVQYGFYQLMPAKAFSRSSAPRPINSSSYLRMTRLMQAGKTLSFPCSTVTTPKSVMSMTGFKALLPVSRMISRSVIPLYRRY